MNAPEGQTGGTAGAAYTPGMIPHERLEFWADTCREMTQMHAGSKQAIDLYRNYGCRFFEPGLEQVLSVVEALDSAVPLWEKTHPELFYQTLELNFPALVRHPC